MHLNLLVPSGMTPLPWVARIFPHRLVLPDLQNLHSLHSGVLGTRDVSGARCDGQAILDSQREPTQVSLLESDDVVAGLHVGNALANRLDDAGTLVTEDNGEGALGVLAGKGVGI